MPRIFGQALARRPRFGVFSLFEPRLLTLRADQPLLLHSGPAHQSQLVSPAVQALRVRSAGGSLIEVTGVGVSFTVPSLMVTSASGDDALFTLAVPASEDHGSIAREFRGTLAVSSTGGALVPTVTMDEEAAVGCIVLAEAGVGAVDSYLQAQAIVSRSFLQAAASGHVGYDFCDTTHCQFLREAPAAGSAAAFAARATRGLALTFEGRVFAAMYSRSCGGRTRTPAELGLAAAGYPYYAVECPFCKEHPERWEREVPALGPAAQLRGERERLAMNRVLGWSALPSGSFEEVAGRLEGRGTGHGIGLCQLGAAALATKGWSSRRILEHFYPNTAIGA